MFSRQLDLYKEQLTIDTFRDLPDVVYCSNDLTKGTRRRPKKLGVEHAYLSYNQKLHGVIILDLDYAGAGYAYKDKTTPPPNFVVMNKENRHAHYIWKLEHPVFMYDAENTKPMKLLSVVNTALTQEYEADPMYSGFIGKSLWSDRWQVERVDPQAYDLKELRKELPDVVIKKAHATGAECYTSRNVALFHKVRRQVYPIWWKSKTYEHFYQRVLEQVWTLNSEIGHTINPKSPYPLLYNEVRSIAVSISRWTWNRFSREEADRRFSERQSKRGSLKGAKLREALLPRVVELRSQGLTQQEISHETGVGQRTISRWLKRAQE